LEAVWIMIISFYDKDFNGLQDNASLVIDNNSYSLIKRGVELDELKCTCEPFIEDIQPTFIVVKNDKGNYVYGCLAGIPALTAENKTVITGTDLKSMLKSDVLLDFDTMTTVDEVFDYVFEEWDEQVNQGSFDCELHYNDNVGVINFESLYPVSDGKYNVWTDIFAPYLRYYGLYMTSRVDLVEKKVRFTIGKSMHRDLNIKLWEHGNKDYGKWVADTNETQGYVLNTDTGTYTAGYKWILTSDSAITTNEANRDIYPVKRKIVLKETDDISKITQLLNEANQEALELLCRSMYQEDITLSGIDADFETKFNIYVRRGEGLYKSLPCGELHYDASGLKKVQIGYRFTGLQFLI
jgi:hypothetical protein